MTRSPWDVPDPWPERIRQWTAVRIVCPTIGHRWRRKMYGRICARCGAFDPD